MKFAAAAIFAAFGLADAKRVSRATEKKQALLRKAIPVNADGTRRQLGEEFQVSGYNAIVFQDCLSLTWQNEEALDENLVESTATGDIIPQTSYAIFKLFDKRYSSYAGSSDGLFMLPLADWIEATALSDFQEKENYCQACEKSYDYCYPQNDYADAQYDNAQYDNANDADADGGERKRFLKRKLTDKVIKHREAMNAIMGKRRHLDDECQEYVNCYTCEERGCFEEEEEANDDQNNNLCDAEAYQYGCEFEEDAVMEFMQGAACVDSGYVEYDQNGDQIELKAGLMCNADGTGVEMAMFADDECSLYYTHKDFTGTMAGTYTYALLGTAAQQIMKPYVNSIDCIDCEYMELAEDDGQYDEQQEANGEAPEASETCQNIMQEALDVETCAGGERKYQENQYEYNQNNNDGQYIPDAWYTYDFTDGEQPDADDVCFYLQDLNGEYSGKHVYNGDSKNGGSNFFDYKAASGKSDGSSAGKTFGIIVAVIVVVVAGVMIVQNFNAKKDSKKQPLVSNNDKGAMA